MSDQLLNVLERCMTACGKCINECLTSMDPSRQKMIRLAWDCMEVCSMAARYVARGSRFTNELLTLCSQMCKACEVECRSVMGADHSCAEVCHECHLACALVAQPNFGRDR